MDSSLATLLSVINSLEGCCRMALVKLVADYVNKVITLESTSEEVVIDKRKRPLAIHFNSINLKTFFKFLERDTLEARCIRASKYVKQGLHPSHAENKAKRDILGDTNGEFLYKQYRGILYKMFVASHGKRVEALAKKYCTRSGGRVFPPLFDQLLQHLPIIEQALLDGQDNLIPILLATGKTPQELRKELGKGIWKKLAANSFHRNKVFAKVFNKGGYNGFNTYAMKPFINIPTTLLQTIIKHSIMWSDIDYLVRELRGSYSKPDIVRAASNTYTDTRRMAERLQQPFNPAWGRKRMEEEHHRLTLLETTSRYSNKQIDWLRDLKVPLNSSKGNFTASILQSELEVGTEGKMMHHCVGSYAGRVRAGTYLVVSIKDACGERYSTLGLSITHYPDSPAVEFNQHYKKFNKEVDDKEVVEYACDILKALKEQVEVCEEAVV